MKNLQRKTLTFFSLTSIVVVLAIIVFINLISLYIFTRFDFTTGKIYSLSKPSKKMLRNLSDRIIIKAYFSRNLPPDYAENQKYLEDLLTEYRAYSGGKIKYRFVDPAGDRDILNEVRSLGIPPLRFTQIEKDKYEVKEGYMGIGFIFGDKREVIPVVKEKQGLEYDISSKIKKLISTKQKVIAFTTGHDEMSIPPELSDYMSSSQYNIRNITISEKGIEGDIDSLCIVGPKRPFNDKEITAIEQFLLQGKSIAMLLDSHDVSMESFQTRKIDNGLENFLTNYGVKVLSGLVLDWKCNRISMRSQRGIFQMENIMEYPFFPIGSAVSKDNPVVKGLDDIPLIYISPIEITKKDEFDVEVLVQTSGQSWYMEDVFFVSPFARFVPGKDDKRGPFNVAVAVKPKKGKTYKAYYTSVSTSIPNVVNESKNIGRIVLFSTSKFVERAPELFMNIVDWTAQDEELIGIRSKGGQLRALRSIPYGIRILYKYANILIMPIVVILYGFYRAKKREIVKKKYQETYG